MKRDKKNMNRKNRSIKEKDCNEESEKTNTIHSQNEEIKEGKVATNYQKNKSKNKS